MPKIVDHDKQRQRVAEAALRVIQRGGLEKATVRNIAEEAGLSVGSLRHYFTSQAELLTFCMKLIIERIEERFSSLSLNGPVFEDVKQVLMQFLPMDEDRTMEMEVWMSFVAKALVYPELRIMTDHMYDGLTKACHYVVDTLVAHKLAKSELDLEYEKERIYALVDGLAIHHIMRPQQLATEKIERIIDQHLRSLCLDDKAMA
ncbi:TetR/AcrR family transcriptional regulator [Paenibacillus sp. ISL-20]|uniref:TetR/AcrR family transcriptional regulator n=1 Tax=Paenibacillus sp. ISL-20 TaxID=2819163 RepID=UPI001BE7E85B|nr:TetR/AcrR family transcriptional regulator [Paenibacillus sp. ISL-20]MBT2760037.1 TetR family transcriptional regulator [Paenibacillus sp. ISL-20]